MRQPIRVVFLDIDGVLVTRASVSTRHPIYRCNLFHRPAVRALNAITNLGEAAIVMSSTWRLGDTAVWARTVMYLRDQGVEAPVIGRTPDMSGKQRGDEIAKWVAEGWPIESYVVLDDDSDMDAVRKHWLQCSMEHGLTAAHIPHALRILNSEAGAKTLPGTSNGSENHG